MWKRRSAPITLLLGICSLCACNSVTGVDELTIVQSDAGLTPFIEPLLTIPGLGMTEISLYQSVKVPLMLNGTSSNSVLPIIAGRDALVRVYLTTDVNYNGDPVTARLFLDGNPVPFEVTQSGFSKVSTEADLNSTLNIKIPGAALTAFTSYKLLVGKPSTEGALPGTTLVYPPSDFDSLPVRSVGAGLKLVLVPISYGADGSNRVPPTTDDILQQYADGFRAMYPIPNIQVSVRAPMPWSQPLSTDGTGWPELLDAVTMLRAKDAAPFDVYYFGIFQPAPTFIGYCGAGCVLGLANLVMSPADSTMRAGIGASYMDDQMFGMVKDSDDSIETVVHEIGHTHGRQHSPSCMAAGPDPAYPYFDGKDGVWGMDLIHGNKLFDPTIYYDVMGYCTPNWISDYTYNALYERIKAVNTTMAKVVVPDALRDLTYDRILINQRGEMKWMPPVKLALPPHGEEQTVVLESRFGAEPRTAQFFRLDHLEGGTLIWPSTGRPGEAIRFDYAGKNRRVVH